MSNSSSKGTALITGPSRGNGAVYLDRAYDLILVARSEATLQSLAATLSRSTGRRTTPIVADVNNRHDLPRVEAKLKDDPSITMVVKNAGCASVAPLLDAVIEKMEDVIALNVTALTRLRVRNASPSLLLAQKFLPIFRWAGTPQLPEYTRKVLLRFEAAGHGDIQDSHVGRPQHLLCALDSMVRDKLVVRAFPS